MISSLLQVARNAKHYLERKLDLYASFRHKDKMCRFYSQFLKKGDICFDVGANIGNRVEIFLKLGCSVLAIEPLESCVNILKTKFAGSKNITIVPKACGKSKGSIKIQLCDLTRLSSVSQEWINTVKSTGRFGNHDWHPYAEVEIVTLDSLIEEFGKPEFIKIDVEGYELEVLSGLNCTVKALSFEFVPEYLTTAAECLKHLKEIGMTKFNYSLGESMELGLPEWVDAQQIEDALRSLPDKSVFGDVYAKSAL